MRGLGATSWGVFATVAMLYCAAIVAAGDLCAQENRGEPPPPEGVGSHEIWAGGDAGAHNWLVYSGGTYAPWSDIHGDGFRLRATSGYGAYDYRLSVPGGATSARVRVNKTYGDVLAGYQMRFGDLTAKVFGGWSFLDDTITVPFYGARGIHSASGMKGALELWLNLGAKGWTSLDANYADTQQTWSVRSRVGYRVLPTVSIGAEGVFNAIDRNGLVAQSVPVASAVGDLRVGGFVRYEWFGGEISASGGVSSFEEVGAKATDLLHDPAIYGTLNFIVQY